LQLVKNDAVRTAIGWGLWGAVFGLTVFVTGLTVFRRWRRGLTLWPSPVGPRPAFLLFGALLTCYHFMHYDVLPMALPAALLVADAGRLSRRGWYGLIVLGAATLACSVDLGMFHGSLRIPFETFLLLIMWGWTGYLTLREPLQASPQRIVARKQEEMALELTR
jgi:hypothetical protein